MGYYINKDDVLNAYPRIKELYEANRITDLMIENWISQAESLIHSKVGVRYKVPFETKIPLIVSIALQLVEYFEEKDIHTPTSTAAEVPWLYARYDRLLDILNEIRDEKITLIDENGNEIKPSNRKLNLLSSNHLEVKQIFSLKDIWELEVDKKYGEE